MRPSSTLWAYFHSNSPLMDLKGGNYDLGRSFIYSGKSPPQEFLEWNFRTAIPQTALYNAGRNLLNKPFGNILVYSRALGGGRDLK
ncbi:hypothetical protein CDAR_174301 [Caerostris darwini]|uniref:Uncharacterized protein n=1 Tax=Caerostris darwini TaxID=1538125 RepID=A0AAV4VIT3_9ARAC|nr:hypothetical protein CDAR_174301 [Caerostris darwini]